MEKRNDSFHEITGSFEEKKRILKYSKEFKHVKGMKLLQIVFLNRTKVRDGSFSEGVKK